MRRVLLGAAAAVVTVSGMAVTPMSAANAQLVFPGGGEECREVPGRWIRWGIIWYYEPAKLVCSDDPDWDDYFGN